jgi:hypothetical protein
VAGADAPRAGRAADERRPPVLEAMLEAAEAAGPGSVALAEKARAAAAVDAVRAAFPNVERGSRIAMILRYGWAPDPSARVRRLPLDESVSTGTANPLQRVFRRKFVHGVPLVLEALARWKTSNRRGRRIQAI